MQQHILFAHISVHVWITVVNLCLFFSLPKIKTSPDCQGQDTICKLHLCSPLFYPLLLYLPLLPVSFSLPPSIPLSLPLSSFLLFSISPSSLSPSLPPSISHPLTSLSPSLLPQLAYLYDTKSVLEQLDEANVITELDGKLRYDHDTWLHNRLVRYCNDL